MTAFGYLLSAEEVGPRELVDTARSAQSAGFDRVWLSAEALSVSR